MGVRIRKFVDERTNNDEYLVEDLDDFYIESPLFNLSISDNSAYKGTIETPMEAGEYSCVTVGVFVIISEMPKGPLSP